LIARAGISGLGRHGQYVTQPGRQPVSTLRAIKAAGEMDEVVGHLPRYFGEFPDVEALAGLPSQRPQRPPLAQDGFLSLKLPESCPTSAAHGRSGMATELKASTLGETAMKKTTAIQHVVLDFDGTCTQIPKVWETYLDLYFKALREAGFDVSTSEWSEACAAVRKHSPKAGWTLAGCAAAPAAADPYILADEAMRLILRRRGDRRPVPAEINAKAYGAAPAPWRPEALDTFAELIERGLRLHFVSNSSTVVITGRLNELLANHGSLRDKISVQSDAGKFRVCELEWDEKLSPSSEARRRFGALPAAWDGGKFTNSISRPVYLRRGAYFNAISGVLRGKFTLLASTVFCGDIWEMDLAMPHALGANVHLVDRAAPFNTYKYEKQAIATYGRRAKTSADLRGLLDWL
jgi:hypothetical protein